jgi:ubiquinone biosynthesis monooxygenase Coq7
MFFVDKLIIGFDQALKTVFAPAQGFRSTPGQVSLSEPLSDIDKQAAIRMMRINHAGEVCAQALYQGQSVSARNPEVQIALKDAAREEIDHLAWCETRLEELGGRKSILNPLWYSASFGLGVFSGLLGDKWNLAFLVETERQVEGHLQGHLEKLSPVDHRTRAIMEQMKADEITHAETGVAHGAAELPYPVKIAMKLSSRLMTKSAYWI